MKPLLSVWIDLLKEASERRWILAIAAGITLILLTMACALQLDVVDGALAATRFFGKPIRTDIGAVDQTLRPLFEAVSDLLYYGSLTIGIFVSADFGPSLLEPGRIEQLLALPLRRWELLAGTFLGVLTLVLVGNLYASLGVTAILGVKTGYWTVKPVASALMATVAFISLYGVILATSLFVRSASISGTAGFLLFIAGIVASFEKEVAGLFKPGIGRVFFEIICVPLPKIGSLGVFSQDLGYVSLPDWLQVSRLLLGHVLFGGACLMIGLFHFERKDF